jgi:REP element-mobilizing transposase RayT
MTFNSIHIPGHLYFVTATTCGWKKIFARPAYAKIVLDSLAWLRLEQRLLLYAYVLMPSHLHAVLKPVDRTIPELINNLASFTAHRILDRLRVDHENELLAFFHAQRRDKRHEHSIWQDVQAKNVFSRDFLIQKVEYIHQNPIDKEWKLVEDRADYAYSSACFYDRGVTPIIEVDDVRDIM